MAKPKQGELPGMEDRKRGDLHDAAEEFLEHKDALSTLKETILGLMHKYKISKYSYKGLEVDITQSKEHVKVKFRAQEEEEEAA